MRNVIGIDAAWTIREPSGVALVEEMATGWRLVSVAPSYRAFYDLAPGDEVLDDGPSDYWPKPRRLLNTAHRLSGGRVQIIAVDMPLANSAITGRRVSDDAVSRAYGARHCGTHSPNVIRPGPISRQLSQGFTDEGYPLSTASLSLPGVIEVYPHPALVELARSPRRLPYKLAKIRAYWRDQSPAVRKSLLLGEWSRIVDLLEERIIGVRAALPALPVHAPRKALKGYEDQLDAVVCAWVAVCALEDRAEPYGDQDSAIWIPTEL